MTTPPPPTEAVPNPHTVVAKLDGDQMTVTFTCAGDAASECHQYSACDRECWDDQHEHPKVPHKDCWVQQWFDAPSVDYCGSDAADDLDGITPTIERTGAITFDCWGGYAEWDWASAGDSR